MSSATAAPSSEAFDAWADVYDEQPNPLLMLERRFLSQMLPDARDLHVLDAGCGTGRWLKLLAPLRPASLTGVDTSPEMLQRAAAKLGSAATLHLGSCLALPIPDATIDLALASFVLSYLEDIEAFACEINRVTRSGATIFLTDMHPETAISCNWKRSFKVNDEEKELQTTGRSLQKIADVFQSYGFELLTLIEPSFDLPEKAIFERNGRLELYESVAHLPAIYILHLRRAARSVKIVTSQDKFPDPAKPLRLTGARYALGPESVALASIEVESGSIRSISSRTDIQTRVQPSSSDVIDLSGYLLLPGLINAHDHLEFSLFPNLGKGPYQNSTEWATEIHHTHASVIARYRGVPKPVRLWWGAIRNLHCGVTTVCHHNPLTKELLNPNFPVHVLSKFGWAHSLSLDPNLVHNFDHTPPGLPFVLHAAEGIDSKSEQEIFDLERMQVLNERTVLVHGLALNKKAAALLNQRHAALVICPTSNEFLFHRTPSSALIRSLDTVVLGSDSPLTSAGDLLDEISYAHNKIGLDASLLYEMVTTKSAQVLRLRNGEGYIRPDSAADFIAVRANGFNPAKTIAQLACEQVELVISSGRVQLASPFLYHRLPDALKQGMNPLEIDGHRRWIRAPIDNLLAQAKNALGADVRLGGKRLNHVYCA